MPCYSVIKDWQNFEVVAQGSINQKTERQIDYTLRRTHIGDGQLEVWLIDCPRYYDRTSLYGDNNQAYFDNGERYAFFSVAALDAAERMQFQPNIVHCNDWHTGLAPMILRTKYNKDPFFEITRSVITIHNGAFQGVFDRSQVYFIPEISNVYNDMISQGTYINYLKCGIFYADKINTVSPGYATELTTYLGGHGMTKNYLDRQADLVGIVNGCDYSDWDPQTDKHLNICYGIDTIEEKILGKYILQRELGLSMGDDPLYGMVTRLTDQKGIGILIPIIESFLKHKVQLIILGTGDPSIEHSLAELAGRHKDKFVFINSYDNTMAHRIEAGSDFFLMPSIFEPCGLNQIYSLAYGTLPIVRSVGGLKDTVVDYDSDQEHGNGFIFSNPNSEDLLSCMRRTLIFYLEDQIEMQRIKKNAMRARFSWKESCEKYEKLYRGAMTKPK